MKKVLVMGGTGAMGRYLVPKLADCGYQVDVLSLDDMTSDRSNLRYLKANAMDETVLRELLQNHYNGIVDFMIYGTDAFRDRHPLLLANCEHYIYLSSYRVFAETKGWTKEDSPQLLDVSDNQLFLSTEDYALKKARGEDILEQSPYKNWTIIRPAITYSKRRAQLVTLECNAWIHDVRAGRPVLLPEAAKTVEATMSWGGDVAEMQKRLLFNDNTLCEAFNVTTSEHRTWGTVADYYTDLYGMKVEYVDTDTYIASIMKRSTSTDPMWEHHVRWQLEYDRLFERKMDNRKVLTATGLNQNELMPLYDGLKYERESVVTM